MKGKSSGNGLNREANMATPFQAGVNIRPKDACRSALEVFEPEPEQPCRPAGLFLVLLIITCKIASSKVGHSHWEIPWTLVHPWLRFR